MAVIRGGGFPLHVSVSTGGWRGRLRSDFVLVRDLRDLGTALGRVGTALSGAALPAGRSPGTSA